MTLTPHREKELEEKIAYAIGLSYPLNENGLNEFIDAFIPQMLTIMKSEINKVLEGVEKNMRAHQFMSYDAKTVLMDGKVLLSEVSKKKVIDLQDVVAMFDIINKYKQ